VRFCGPLTFGPIDRCVAILASLFFSFQMKSCTMLCCACRQSKGHHTSDSFVTHSLKEMTAVLNYCRPILTNDFSVLVDQCSCLVDVAWPIKDLKRWCSLTVTNVFNIGYCCLPFMSRQNFGAGLQRYNSPAD